MGNKKILVVDDDPGLRDLLQEYLSSQGYEVATVADGVAMEQHLTQHAADLVILDLMLPGEDGLALARKLKAQGDQPIIMLSARGEDVDRIVGLEVGADDYLAKPFNPRELLARIRAVLRRASEQGQPQARFQSGGLAIDFSAREVMVDGARQSLTAHEYELLCALARNAGRVLSRDQLLELVKGDQADEAFDRSIDVHVSRLRQKIEPDPRHPRYVKTVRGAGYLLARES